MLCQNSMQENQKPSDRRVNHSLRKLKPKKKTKLRLYECDKTHYLTEGTIYLKQKQLK